ncbi:hypothetical protein [Nonomuraea sp. 10N515B]|uniref:hypothetical protein n=1 Tax=Nonomuraea sp. 10N515B TaxID=3457422 RepID=UPI003FCCBCC6
MRSKVRILRIAVMMASGYASWSAATLIVATIMSDLREWAIRLLIGGALLAFIGGLLALIEQWTSSKEKSD